VRGEELGVKWEEDIIRISNKKVSAKKHIKPNTDNPQPTIDN